MFFLFVLNLFPLTNSNITILLPPQTGYYAKTRQGLECLSGPFPSNNSLFSQKAGFLHPLDDAWEDKLGPYRWCVSEQPHHPEALTLYSWLYKHELRFFYNHIKQSVKELWGILLHLAFKLRI